MNNPPRFLYELPYTQDSEALFERIKHRHWPVFLDSAGTAGENSRYDILAADPFTTLETTGKCTVIKQNDTVKESEDDPFLLLDAILQSYPQKTSSLPFSGGAIGYFSYDLGRRVEQLPSIAIDAEQLPDMAVGIYDWAIINDHQTQRCWLVSHAVNHHTERLWPQLKAELTADVTSDVEKLTLTGPLTCNLTEEQYVRAFNKIQHYIREGDCYQVNLAKRYEVTTSGHPWSAYKQLRTCNPAPFSVYFSTGETTVMSSSPERLLRVNESHVETKPIKGTRPRDLDNPTHDQQLAVALQNSVKDRAENLMIVDLLRNDLGKVCKPGSIRVPAPFALESFATVHHLVSTITGELADTQSPVSLLRACFPGGSITGAPKLRAMQIIEELEPHRRGIYCGSIGYIGFDGQMDSNITIRTMVHSDNRLRFWAGGGIVADSQAEAEYQEVHDKAQAMLGLIDRLAQP
jgi:para-aminobenzoate synthetase component 1